MSGLIVSDLSARFNKVREDFQFEDHRPLLSDRTAYALYQRLPADELHDEEVPARIRFQSVNRCDVEMIQRRENTRTLRPSFEPVAAYTSPIPPDPRCPVMS